jgi:RND family efflux transporter MFP subunit
MSLRFYPQHILLGLSLLLLATFFTPVNAKQNMIVDVYKAKKSTTGPNLNISGTLTAERRSLLSPRIDGLIKQVNVDAGSQVKKGDTLLTMDAVISQLELQQVKANVIKAEVDLNEAKRLVAEAERLRLNKYIPESELANRQASQQIKQAELLATKAMQASMQEQIKRHRLIAPYAGVISAKNSEAGEWARRGDAVLELVNLERIRLDVNLPQERFNEISINTPVKVIAEANPKQKLSAKIQAIVPVSNSQVRAFLVRVTLDNYSLSLLPGTSAIAQFSIKTPDQNTVLIPRDALLINPDGSHTVFVVDTGKAFRRKVTIDKITSKGAHISKGIVANDLVVIRGNEVLTDQQLVIINQTAE